MLMGMGGDVGHINIPHKGRKEKSKHGRINKQRGVGSNSYQFEERKKFHTWKRYRAYPRTELATDHCGGLRCDLPKEKENTASSSKIR